MSELMKPYQVRYRLVRIFSKQFDEIDDPHYPSSAGLAAKVISEKYEEDYNRCKDICEMIREDAKGKNDDES